MIDLSRWFSEPTYYEVREGVIYQRTASAPTPRIVAYVTPRKA